MPFTMPSFPLLNAQQASPYAGLIQNMLDTYQNAVKARYAQPEAQQALQNAILQNTGLQQQQQWNPKIWQSEIGLREKQGQLAGSQAGLAGAETGLTNVNTQQELLKLHYLQQMMGNNAAYNNTANQLGGSGGYTPVNYSDNGQPPTQQITGSNGTGNAGTALTTQNQSGNVIGSNANAISNSVYGIPTPTPSPNDIKNKMLLGIDTFSAGLENAKNQQQDQYNKYQDTLTNLSKTANAANASNQLINQFNAAMDKSMWTGPTFGHISTAIPLGNMAPEQQADRTAMQLLPGAISQLQDVMHTGRFSNLDVGMAQQMKFDRAMSDPVRENMTKWVGGVNDRLMEEQKFYNYFNDPHKGARINDANALWSAYQQEFPLVDKNNNFQPQNLNKWALYTTPKALASIKATGSYVPTAAERNATMMWMPYPNGQYVLKPIKKGAVEKALRLGGKIA